MEQPTAPAAKRLPKWALAIFPLIILLALTALFALLDPLAFFKGTFPPLEELTIQRIFFPEQGQIQVELINGAPDPVNVAQVLVDDAYWQFTIDPEEPLSRLEQATIQMAYPWVHGEPLEIVLITSTGTTESTSGSSLLCWACSGIRSCAVSVKNGSMPSWP